ncbi:unnamed protein product [Cuscuta europaea]|uniref:Uncharacterized protein n=1 Tax=Cuscuta europaea TaxID=41803 RepID=A0A9P0Z9M7_CUSEU|nr:unnamed protein product [Cuscuta europaea]
MALGYPKNKEGGGSWLSDPPRALKTLQVREGQEKIFGILRMQPNFQYYVFFTVVCFGNTIFVVVVYFYFCHTLALGWGDEGSILITLDSFRPIIGSASHIAFSRVVGSKSGSRVGGWKWSFYLLVPLLKALILI